MKAMAKRLLFCCSLFWAGSAGALMADSMGPGTYLLLDHPAGNLTGDPCCGPYGLRLDFLNPPSGVGPTFSLSSNGAFVTLEWKTDGTAVISGNLWNNSTSEMWAVNYVLTGLVETATGFSALAGTGTLTDGGTTIDLTGKADGSGYVFAFYADGHRLSGDNYTPVGRGWLDEDGTNDWIFKASKVPEPASFLLLATGLLAAGGLARRHG